MSKNGMTQEEVNEIKTRVELGQTSWSTSTIVKLLAEVDRRLELGLEVAVKADELRTERDALRVELAAVKERLYQISLVAREITETASVTRPQQSARYVLTVMVQNLENLLDSYEESTDD